MKGIKHLGCLICFLICSSRVESKVYKVGDSENWTTGVNYLSWSQKYNFTVGDVLVFTYIKGQHNTCQVTQSTYQSCNSSTGVLARYENGNDRITLDEAKKFWFICDVTGHCLGGMRFAIQVSETNQNVNDNNNNSNSNSNNTNLLPPEVPPSSNHSCEMKSMGASIIYCLAALGFLLGVLT